MHGHLFHSAQDTSGQWCVGRVMERETLSNNTEYQERLREGRIKGVLKDRGNTMMKELMMVLDQESRQLQQQVSVVRSRYNGGPISHNKCRSPCDDVDVTNNYVDLTMSTR